MAKLDKLKIIDLLPNNFFKSLIAENFRWISGGALKKFMEQEVMVKFMAPKQNEPWHFRFYLRGRYSQSIIRRNYPAKTESTHQRSGITELRRCKLALEQTSTYWFTYGDASVGASAI